MTIYTRSNGIVAPHPVWTKFKMMMGSYCAFRLCVANLLLRGRLEGIPSFGNISDIYKQILQ